MPRIARNDDVGSHGGNISAVTTKTYVNGRLVLTVGAIYHCSIHSDNLVVEGSPDVYRENMKVARLGDHTACGAVIASASDDTFANG